MLQKVDELERDFEKLGEARRGANHASGSFGHKSEDGNGQKKARSVNRDPHEFALRRGLWRNGRKSNRGW